MRRRKGPSRRQISAGLATQAKRSKVSRRLGAHIAGKARAAKLTPEEASEYGRALVKKRWDKVRAQRAAEQSIDFDPDIIV